MTSTEFNSSIAVSIAPKQAFEMISRVSEWWVKDVEGKTERLNDEFIVHFGTTWAGWLLRLLK